MLNLSPIVGGSSCIIRCERVTEGSRGEGLCISYLSISNSHISHTCSVRLPEESPISPRSPLSSSELNTIGGRRPPLDCLEDFLEADFRPTPSPLPGVNASLSSPLPTNSTRRDNVRRDLPEGKEGVRSDLFIETYSPGFYTKRLT